MFQEIIELVFKTGGVWAVLFVYSHYTLNKKYNELDKWIREKFLEKLTENTEALGKHSGE